MGQRKFFEKLLFDKCRQVFNMSRDHELSNKEISHEMQITVSTVEQHITRAIKTLRNEIKSPAEF